MIDIIVIKIGIIGTNANNAVEPNIPPVICKHFTYSSIQLITFPISGTNSSKMMY